MFNVLHIFQNILHGLQKKVKLPVKENLLK